MLNREEKRLNVNLLFILIRFRTFYSVSDILDLASKQRKCYVKISTLNYINTRIVVNTYFRLFFLISTVHIRCGYQTSLCTVVDSMYSRLDFTYFCDLVTLGNKQSNNDDSNDRAQKTTIPTFQYITHWHYECSTLLCIHTLHWVLFII